MIDAVTAETVTGGGGTVITATHGLARQLRWQHDQAQVRAGLRAWPSADVLALDAWLRRRWEHLALVGTPLGRLRLLSDDESRLVWRRILERAAPDDLDAGLVIPLVAAGWRLCQTWGIQAGQLHGAADSEDGRAFAHWVDAYVRELDGQGWIDSGGLLQALGAGHHAAAPDHAPLYGFAGFDPWTPALNQLASRLEADGLRVVSVVPRRHSGTCQVLEARDEGAEIAMAFHWAAQHARSGSGAGVAIIVSDLEQSADWIRRTGLDILAPGWRLQEPAVRPVALAAGRQLADYPVIACALTLLRLLAAELTFDQASVLLRSPYVAGADTERTGRAQAELALRRLPLERMALSTLLGVLGEGAPQVAAQWQRAGALAAPLLNRQLPPSQWARHFSHWLAAAGWTSGRRLGSEEFQAVDAWQRLLQSFAGTDEVAGGLALRRALGILVQQARDRPFEPESAAEAVQVLSLREAGGRDFDALWICGMTADQWPPAPRSHPLVPLALQQAAGVPEAHAATLEAYTRRRFEELLSAAASVALSWPAQQGETETLPSPLLADPLVAGAAPASPTAEATGSHPDRLLIAASATPECAAEDGLPVWPAERLVPGGTKVLTLQARCPARAVAECRWRALALEAPVRPLDAATRGKVVHRLLERIYRTEACSHGLGRVPVGLLRAVFDPLVSTVLDEYLPAGEPFLASLRPLETERLWTLLQSLGELERERPGFHVVTEVERRVTVGPLALRIRLDRLDQLEEGGELVLDYKTGRFAPSGWKAPRLPESQLPLYAVTAGSRGVAVITCRAPAMQLLGVGDAALGIPGIKSPAAFFRDDSLSWGDILERWRQQLQGLAVEFAAGDFRVDPTDRQWATGQFAGLTRIHEVAPLSDDDAPRGEEQQ